MKVLSKVSSLSAPAKSAVWFVVCSVLQRGIVYITTPIFTRLLTTEQFGTYTMYNSWFSVITIVCTLNLSYNVFHRAMVKYPDDKDGYTSSMQGLTTLITLVVFSTFLIFPTAWEQALQLPDELIFCMFLEMLFAPAFYFWQTRQRFEYRYVALAVVTISMTLISTVLGVVAVMLTNYGALARIYPVVATDVIVGIFFTVLQYARGRKVFSKKYWGFALGFNLPLLPHYLSTVVLNQADRVMIGQICGMDDVAIYGVAYSLAMAASLFIGSVNSSLIPWTYQQLEKHDPAQTRRIGDIGLMLSTMLAAILLLVAGLGPEIMMILGPESYQAAIWVIPPVALSVLASMYVWLFVNVETYYEENGYVAAVSIGAAALNVVLNLVALPVFGFVAAGWTTFASYVAMALGHAYFTKRIQGKRGEAEAYRARPMLLLAAGTTAFSMGFMALYALPLVRYAAIAALCVVAWVKRDTFKSALSTVRAAKKKPESEGEKDA